MERKRPGGEMKTAEPQQATQSELLPMNFERLMRKTYVLPGAATIVALGLLMFCGHMILPVHLGDPESGRAIAVPLPLFDVVLGAYLSLAFAYLIYRIVGKPKALPTIIVIAAVTGLLTNWSSLFFAFHHLVDFGHQELDMPAGTALPDRFLNALLTAGLPEELFKALPVAVCVWLGRTITDRSSPLWRFRVVEPIDGIVIGAAAGIGFAFVETIFLYVPMAILRAIIENQANIAETARTLLGQNGTLTIDSLAAAVLPQDLNLPLERLVTRLIADLCGHPAYSGILGYYIGLAVLRPNGRVKALLTGLGIAATLHAVWDMDMPDFLRLGLSMLSFFMLAAVVMKAREISPNRDELMASQILDHVSEIRGHPGMAATPVAPLGEMPDELPTRNVRAANPQRSFPLGSAAGSITWTPPRPALASETWDPGPVIELGGRQMPIRAGEKIYEAQAPGVAAAQDDGVIAEVVPHPQDASVLGLMNRSRQAWDVTTAKGDHRQIEPARSIRLASGTRIRLGDTIAEVR
jgi:RsiW-degrading membrane proteinase PrsW (M82 family)